MRNLGIKANILNSGEKKKLKFNAISHKIRTLKGVDQLVGCIHRIKKKFGTKTILLKTQGKKVIKYKVSNNKYTKNKVQIYSGTCVVWKGPASAAQDMKSEAKALRNSTLLGWN